MYERTTSLRGCFGYERMELKKDKIVIWNYDKCGAGKMHLSEICYGKWKLVGSRIANLMDSVYEYDYSEKLERIIRISHPDNVFKFEYPDSVAHRIIGYYLTYDRPLHIITDTTQTIIITNLMSLYHEWAEYKKVK